MPISHFSEFIQHRKEFIRIDDFEIYKRARVQLHWRGIVLRDEIEGAAIKTKEQQVARGGELLVAEIDAKVGGVGMVPPELDGSIVSSHYFLFEIDENKCLREWLDFYIRSGLLEDQLVARGSTNYAAIRPHHALACEMPLPTLDEQRRIVARIEELSAKIEEARTLRQESLEASNALLTSTITSAFVDISIDGQLGEVIVENPRNGWSARCNNAEEGTPVLSLSAVTGFQYRPHAFKRTSEPTTRDAHYWLRDGDLLITRSNTPELVGHAAIYNGSPYPCIYPDLMMRIGVNEERADKRFVHRWLMSTPVRDYIRSAAKGTSPTMKKISQNTVMRIPFPSHISIKEQRRIVAYLDNLQAKVDAVKKMQEETAKELNALMPSILSRAFSGEL